MKKFGSYDYEMFSVISFGMFSAFLMLCMLQHNKKLYLENLMFPYVAIVGTVVFIGSFLYFRYRYHCSE